MRTTDPPHPIYVIEGDINDPRYITIQVYELERENEHTLFLKFRGGTKEFRKGKRRARDLMGPPPWFRTEDEVLAEWHRLVQRAISHAEGKLADLKAIVEVPFYQVPYEGDPADIAVQELHKVLHEIAERLKSEGMQCNCDLDNWEPERSTGHSHVCRIHQAAIKAHLTRK